MSQSILLMRTRRAKENLLSTWFTDIITRNNHLYIMKKKHQNTSIILIIYNEKGQIMLRFLLKLLNL